MRHLTHTDAHGHQWVFIWTEETVTQLLRLLGWYAVNPETTFSWYDAGVVAKKVRQVNWEWSREHANKL